MCRFQIRTVRIWIRGLGFVKKIYGYGIVQRKLTGVDNKLNQRAQINNITRVLYIYIYICNLKGRHHERSTKPVSAL